MFVRLSIISCPECGYPNEVEISWLASLDMLTCGCCGTSSEAYEERYDALKNFNRSGLGAHEHIQWIKS